MEGRGRQLPERLFGWLLANRICCLRQGCFFAHRGHPCDKASGAVQNFRSTMSFCMVALGGFPRPESFWRDGSALTLSLTLDNLCEVVGGDNEISDWAFAGHSNDSCACRG